MAKEINCLSLYSGGAMPKLPSRSFFKLMLLGFHAGYSQATNGSNRRDTYGKFVAWMEIDKLTYERSSYVDHQRFGAKELTELHKFISEKENCYQLYSARNFNFDLDQTLSDQRFLNRFLKPSNTMLCTDAGSYLVLGLMHVIKWTFVGYYHGTILETKFRSIELIINDFERWIRITSLIKVKISQEEYVLFLSELDILKKFRNAADMIKN